MENYRFGRGEGSTGRTIAILPERQRFEAEWRAGYRPRIEQYLADEAEPSKLPGLFQALIESEVALRREAGEQPTAAEYRDRFPNWPDAIDAACLSLTDPETDPASTLDREGSAISRAMRPAFRGDRNMLIGLLAMQNGFIDHATLVDAIHAWIADKERPLGMTLVGWGALDIDQLDVLERMAHQHIKRDRGDTAKSIATASATLSIDDLGPTPNPDAETLPFELGLNATNRPYDRSGSRYRLIRHHARGGLGDVYLAEDQEIGRKVALKEIQPKHVGNVQNRARFVLEAEVTGGLEHPGIVPVYGLGVYQDGRPFYAMRFIKGKTLKQAVLDFRADGSLENQPGERALALRRLLARFVDVCNAIDYAHNRGVLHRDIKPSNIMLGKYGETLVVDWGLAKLLDQSQEEPGPVNHDEEALHPSSSTEVDPTRMRSVYGTVQYMSPEQADGQIDQLTPATDVYGLGATLYYLLTGQSRFPEIALAKIKPALMAGDFHRPREVDHRVDPPLESICLKAMAVKPPDRYESAHALADDIERWLADEPVAAHPDPFAARLGRWTRRHRPLVVGSTMAMMVAVVGLLIHGFVVGMERDRAERGEKAALIAEAKAGTSFSRIEETLGITRQTIETLMVTLAGEKLATTPKLQELRGYIGDETVKVSRNLLKQRPNDPYIKVTAAPIFHYAAVMHRLLGRYHDSFVEFDQAIKLYEDLIVLHPERRFTYLDVQARVTIDYAEARRLSGDDREALRLFDKARDLATRLKKENLGNTAYIPTLARSRTNAAEILRTHGRFEEANACSEESVRFLRERMDLKKDRSAVTPMLFFFAIRGQAIAASELGRSEIAAKLFDESEKVIGDLEAATPSDNNTRYLRATVHYERGLFLAKVPEKRALAEAELTLAIDQLDQVIKAGFESVIIYQVDLARWKGVRAKVRSEMGEAFRAGALTDATEAIATLKSAHVEQVKEWSFASIMGLATGTLARLELDPARSRRLFEESIGYLDMALVLKPESHIDQKARRESQAEMNRSLAPR